MKPKIKTNTKTESIFTSIYKRKCLNERRGSMRFSQKRCVPQAVRVAKIRITNNKNFW